MQSRDTREQEFAAARRAMVENQIHRRGVLSPVVLGALLHVPRHKFVPAEFQADAYADRPLPIGDRQTISQPYMVGAMTEALELSPSECVLEIGTGSGYQTAVLSLLTRKVFSVESHEALAIAARERLARLGYANVHVHTSDGSQGLPEAAPYDAILVAAAAPRIPPVLVEQLREGGRLVIPVGSQESQQLVQGRKERGMLVSRELFDCQFVPLLGRFGWSRDEWVEDQNRRPGVSAS